MRRFYLVRSDDVSKVSGLGVVAEGVIFGDGSVELRWRTTFGGHESWPNLKKCAACHSHDGRTRVVFVDEISSHHVTVTVPMRTFGEDLYLRNGQVHRLSEYKFKPPDESKNNSAP